MAGEENKVDALTPEQLAAQEAEDFKAGYDSDDNSPAAALVKPTDDSASEDDSTDDDKDKDGDGEDDQAAKVDADSDPAKPDPLTDLEKRLDQKWNDRLRNMEGHIGGIKSSLQKLSASQKQQAANDADKAAAEAGADAPTKAQVSEALANGEKFKALKADFPEWGDAMEESMAVFQAQLEKFKPSEPVDVDGLKTEFRDMVSSSVSEVRELIKIDTKYPGWEETAQTPAFIAWMQEQPEDILNLAASTKAADAIKMFDMYTEHQKKVAAAKAEKAAKDKKLEDAITPTGTNQKPAGKTEEDEFETEFNNT